MKISYYTGIVGSEAAETALWKTYAACRQSKLPFICDVTRFEGCYNITVELKPEYCLFTDWVSMEEYIRQFIVENNRAQHYDYDMKRLEEKLCQLQNQ